MIKSSLRARLTLWYAGSLTAILLLLCAGIYSLYARTIANRLDAELNAAVQLSRITLQHEIEEHGGQGPGEESVRQVFRTIHQNSYPRVAIAIWNGTRFVAEKPGSEGLGHGAMPPSAPAGIRTIVAGDTSYRVASEHIPQGYVAIANQSTRAIDTELANLRNVLMLLIPTTILLAVTGGLLIAQKGLDPVARMAQTAKEITSANLGRRLTIANPKDELGSLGCAFNSLLDRLESAFSQQQNFIADASHELRTPLHIALAASHLALHESNRGEAELRESLQMVEQQLDRLKRIVGELFLLAQADAGVYTLPDETFYLNDVVAESIRAARVLAASKQIEVEDSSSATDMVMRGDEGLIRQLLLILLENAVKFTPAKGRIVVQLQEVESDFAVIVSDNGPGVSPADRPRIFDRFYRSDRARSQAAVEGSRSSGAGLGLSIGRWIAELHGGGIELLDIAEGSAFRVRLPGDAKHLSSV